MLADESRLSSPVQMNWSRAPSSPRSARRRTADGRGAGATRPPGAFLELQSRKILDSDEEEVAIPNSPLAQP